MIVGRPVVISARTTYFVPLDETHLCSLGSPQLGVTAWGQVLQYYILAFLVPSLSPRLIARLMVA